VPKKKSLMVLTTIANGFTLVPCLAYSSTLKMVATYSAATLATFNGLNSIISQKTDLLMTTAVRTLNFTWFNNTLYDFKECPKAI
jgi:hypothetical protein